MWVIFAASQSELEELSLLAANHNKGEPRGGGDSTGRGQPTASTSTQPFTHISKLEEDVRVWQRAAKSGSKFASGTETVLGTVPRSPR